MFEEEQHQKWESIKNRKSELMVNSLKSTYAGYFACHTINLLPWLLSSLISSVAGQSWILNTGWHESIVGAGGTGARSVHGLISYSLFSLREPVHILLSVLCCELRRQTRSLHPWRWVEVCLSVPPHLSFNTSQEKSVFLQHVGILHLCSSPFPFSWDYVHFTI